jgi:hypothetical protein
LPKSIGFSAEVLEAQEEIDTQSVAIKIISAIDDKIFFIEYLQYLYYICIIAYLVVDVNGKLIDCEN